MAIELLGDPLAAEEIHQMMRRWDEALSTQHLSRLMASYADDVNIFDIGTQFSDQASYRGQWHSCFSYFGDTITIERRHIKIYADKMLALMHCYTRLCGPKTPPPEATPWSRATVCYHKRDGLWQVVHEHISMPIDFNTGAPVLILGEPGA